MESQNPEQPKKSCCKKYFIAFTVIAIVIVGAFSFTVIRELIKLPKNMVAPQAIDAARLRLIEGDAKYWLGTSTPKLTIVEFADYNCPKCRSAFPKIRELGLKYQTLVKVIFRDYPIISGTSQTAAMAAHCAGEQGRFWPMHDKLFSDTGKKTKDNLKLIARQLGLDQEEFNVCLDADRYLSTIKKDVSDAQSLGVEGTPTWFFNGTKVTGDIPMDNFEELIKKYLKSPSAKAADDK